MNLSFFKKIYVCTFFFFSFLLSVRAFLRKLITAASLHVLSREWFRKLHEEWKDLLFVKCAKKRSRMMDKMDFIVHLCPKRREKSFWVWKKGQENTRKRKSDAVNVCVKVKSKFFSPVLSHSSSLYCLFGKMILRFLRFGITFEFRLIVLNEITVLKKAGFYSSFLFLFFSSINSIVFSP